MATEPMEIDDALYSRQRYVLGDNAMQRMAQSDVLLVGLGGLGAEIAKNIVLAGVKSLTVQDDRVATIYDLGSQFFLRQEDVQISKNRAEASVGRIAELNPYVAVKFTKNKLTTDSSLEYMDHFQCVILTEASMPLLLRVNEYCRNKSTSIKFIAVDVRGVFCWSFCDFSNDFEVLDENGEETREVFVANITKANPGVVTTLENKMHGFQTGDVITFKEIFGMEILNSKQSEIKVISPYQFSICDTMPDDFVPHLSGGIAIQVKIPKIVHFESLENQLHKPSLVVPDLAKYNAPSNLHLGMLALHKFQQDFGFLPKVWDVKDAEELLNRARVINNEFKIVETLSINEDLLRQLSYTSQGCLAPLCAFMGGIVAQEAIKGLTGKFSPLNQWLHLDATEILSGLEQTDVTSFQPRFTRYDALRMCIGDDLCKKLAKLKIFMIGCGAIGCEMLKNFAMIGAGLSTASGQLTVTDNDLIEKSNLNRQFLFRPQHISQPKSTTAATAALDINPDLQIRADQHKVGMLTENTEYTDFFFQELDVVVNALDNLEARRYVDSRCVTNQRPLLESGTMGAKGHVQVIIPHLTESYASQNDPMDEDVPFCTLHSFPAVMDHCIEWARDKFENLFSHKPKLYNKFWASQSAEQAITLLESGRAVDDAVPVSKLAANMPDTWQCCAAMGRIKFEKFFNHRAKQLLHAFPIDTLMKDGTPFWQSPKRPPTPLEFDPGNDLHLDFVIACGQLYAHMYGIPWTKDVTKEKLLESLPKFVVPRFQPKSKQIETDVTAKKPEQEEITDDELKVSARRLTQAISQRKEFPPLSALIFEKDNDSNGHIDFIVATSNLRAVMYNLETADRLKIKRIAGRIVPAIATTTAAVAGLVSVELIKIVKQSSFGSYRNVFINLALPMFVLSEAAPPKTTKLSTELEYTLWDMWEIRGAANWTLKNFIEALKAKYNLNAVMVVQGVKMIYVPIMPGHNKRLPQLISSLIKITPGKPYVDLVVSYSINSEEEEMGPTVRYYY